MTTADMRAAAPPRFSRSARIGGCSATAAQVGRRQPRSPRRADRVVSRVRAVRGDVVVFLSAHILRVFAARWLGLEPAGERYLLLGTESHSVLGYEHNFAEPAVRLWNDTRHLERS